MASSTTRPIASTRPKSDSVLMEKPNSGKNSERADERHRNRQQRDQRRPPALQKEIDHRNTRASDHQRFDDFVHSFRDRVGGVDGNGVVEVVRKRCFNSAMQLFHAFGGVDGVGTGQLIQRKNGAWLAVEAADDVVILRAQFDAGHVLEPHDRAAPALARSTMFSNSSSDVEPALGADRVSKFLSGRDGLAADLSRPD